MNQNEEELFFDDNEVIKFILNTLPEETKKHVNDTHIEYVLDVIDDFYKQKGFFDENSTNEAAIDENEMAKYIKKTVEEEHFDLSKEEIVLILNGEFEYGKSIGIYAEEIDEIEDIASTKKAVKKT